MAVTPPWLPGMGPDSIAAGERMAGIVMDNPIVTAPAPAHPSDGMSWIYVGLAALFCLVGFCMRNSPRYWKAVVADLTDTRERGNVFDETVRETTFLVLLNLMWTASAGVLLWAAVRRFEPGSPLEGPMIPDASIVGIGISTAMCFLYNGAMQLAYWVSGYVFREARQASMWVRGAAAATALEAVLFFPLALLVMVRPEWSGILLIMAACVFILGKIVFIFKGIRIFFNHSSSWLLFLYYLCSLEIVPLILTYVLTIQICDYWL